VLGRCFSAALNTTVTLLLISQNTMVKYTWVTSSEDHNRLQQALCQFPYSIHHRHLYTCSNIFRFKSGWRQPSYTPNYPSTTIRKKCVTTSSQFCLGMTKTSDTLNYLTSKLQSSLREPITFPQSLLLLQFHWTMPYVPETLFMGGGM